MHYLNKKILLEHLLQMIKSIKISLVFLFTLCLSFAYAQMPGAGRTQMGGQNMNLGHFYGKVLETISNKPLEAASVLLIQNKFDSATKKPISNSFYALDKLHYLAVKDYKSF